MRTWVVLDTGAGWVIRARCLPGAAIGSQPRIRGDLRVNGEWAAISLVRYNARGWNLAAVWTGPSGTTDKCVASLDRDGLCAACDREILNVGVTEDGTVLIGHSLLH
jgi:hypothetical protein